MSIKIRTLGCFATLAMTRLCALLTMAMVFTFTTPAFATEQPTYPFTSTVDSQRFISLTNEVKCPVCQGQSIADSNAPLAKDLRSKIYQFILEKKSDSDIKTYLTKRYGSVILLQPPINPSTWLLWGFPLIALLATSLFLLRKFSK